jgi:CubicO group peptidase (beta-lactamase class C family)
MRKRNMIFALLAMPFALSLGSCETTIDDICSPAFNSTTFLEQIDSELDGNVMGYAVVITKDGNIIDTHEKGKGIAGNDGNRDMSINDRMHIASISKSLTTIATLKVLRDKGIDVNTSVAAYMPPGWILGTDFNEVTFYELLNQSAGLDMVGTQGGAATRFDSLRRYAAVGARQAKNRRYTNTHHGFMRVILPRLWDRYRPSTGTSGYDAAFYASTFKKCIQENVFDLIGIANVDCTAPANGSYAYSGPNDLSGSGVSNDFSTIAGGLGFHLSTRELAKLWTYTFFTDDILNETDRNLMKDNELGMWNSVTGDKGRYLGKLGGWSYDGNTPSDSYNSCLMSFPNDVQVALIVNSPIPRSLRLMVRDAFDASWNCN